MKRFFTMWLISFMILGIGLGSFQVPVFAQTSVDAERAQLEAELAKLQAEIKQKEAELSSQKKNSASLSRDVTVLTSEINKAKLEITAKNKVLQSLGGQIVQKNQTIQTLDSKRARQEESLSQILRKKNQIDDSTLAELLLSKNTLSGFLNEMDNLHAVDEGIQNSFDVIKSTKYKTNQEKEVLQEKKDAETNVKYQLETQKKQVETKQDEKERMLAISKGQEKNYEAVIKDRQARAAAIRAELIKFQGSGITSKSISFGDAYDYAKLASSKTGVRPALVLAIMQQETGFGNNVGGCYITDLETGDGKSIKSGAAYEKVMGIGSLSHFERITKELGLDWKKTPVSCPIDIKGVGTATKYYQGRGYGGAMGYTQFIPSTWVLVEKRVESNLGIAVANPWNPKHAVMATAIFLADLGAGTQTYTAEKNAACKYYGACSTYGTSVMNKAASIEKTIEQLNQLSN